MKTADYPIMTDSNKWLQSKLSDILRPKEAQYGYTVIKQCLRKCEPIEHYFDWNGTHRRYFRCIPGQNNKYVYVMISTKSFKRKRQ